MKFNYFHDKQNRFGVQNVTRALSGGLIKIAPKLSLTIGKKLLLNPFGKRHYAFNELKADDVINLETSLGKAHISLFGEGQNLVIVSHGWADNSSGFEAMIINLLSQGFKVAAIDHIAHGKSAGKQTHLLNFIETLNATIEHFEQREHHIHAIVAHSMGAVATLNLPEDKLANKKLILIATPIHFFELMFEKVNKAGISTKLLTHVLENIGAEFNRQWQSLCLSQHTSKLSEHIHFIHDEQDKYASYQNLTDYLQTHKSPLFTTQGLGHRRLLGDTKVIQHITQVITT